MGENLTKRAYNVKDLPSVLGISKSAAYQLVRREGFPAVRIGRRILIPVDALDHWFLEQSRKGIAVK